MLNKMLQDYINAYRSGDERAMRAFWEYVVAAGLYDKVRQLVMYQNVIFDYENNKGDTQSIGNGYYLKVYTKEDAEFAAQQIKGLLEVENND